MAQNPVEDFNRKIRELPIPLDVQEKVCAHAEELIMAMGEYLMSVSVDAFALTLLQVYRTGVYPGGLVNKNLHALATILAAAGTANNAQETGNQTAN